MQNFYRSRYIFLLVVIALYLIPILLISNYGKLYMPPQKGWNLLAFGLFCSTIGTLTQFWMLCRLGVSSQEEEKQETLDLTQIPSNHLEEEDLLEEPVIDESLKQELVQLQEKLLEETQFQENLKRQIEEKDAEIRSLCQEKQQEIDQVKQASENTLKEFKEKIDIEQSEQKKQLQDSQKTIIEQRESLDKKLQQIVQLESKVSDLTYEIKTLIQLAEIENQTMPIVPNNPHSSNNELFTTQEIEDDVFCLPEKQVKTASQASIQLKKCIDIAQKITGASYYSNSRFKDLAVDNYALDLRRLFESLRMENASVLIFYSQKENKILFVNNQSRNLLGWSPDKFVQSFLDIVEPSMPEWQQGVSSLSIKNEAMVSLKMKAKAGGYVEVNSLLGIIPTGIFRNHVLGVLYAT